MRWKHRVLDWKRLSEAGKMLLLNSDGKSTSLRWILTQIAKILGGTMGGRQYIENFQFDSACSGNDALE